MTTASVDLEHDGKNWILVVIPAESAERVDVIVSDMIAHDLKKAGVEVYNSEAY
jgi:hypothetical protein